MTSRFAFGVILMPMLVALVSCSGRGNESEFMIDGHRFTVPNGVILPAQVVWFPWPTKTESLHFIINPGMSIGQRASALVESRKITCRPDKLSASPMLAAACSTKRVPVLPLAKLRKEHQFQGNDTFWEYTAEDHAGTRHIVASCYALASQNGAGTCSAFGRYSSLVYSFSIDDSEIGSLSDARSRIESLLGSWERH